MTFSLSDLIAEAQAESRPVAALYVQDGGCYAGLPGVDAWTEDRDARSYPGPFPVVAHPPCGRWGRYWYGSPSGGPRFAAGDDGGCFAAALQSVRRWGGVLEHPAGSKAWARFGLNAPPRGGGWISADFRGGWTCHVDQGHYGHRAPKPTWLYAHGVELPTLRWGASGAAHRVEKMSKRQRAATPKAFRDLLLSIARTRYDR